MKKSENRAPFIFGAIPHSILRRTKQLRNTASALLLYLAERTFAFRKGCVDVCYKKIAQELHVSWRTVARAAKVLTQQGDLIRKRLPGGTYRWWLPLQRSEVISNPDSSFWVRDGSALGELPHDTVVMTPHDNGVITPMTDRSWEHPAAVGALNQDFIGTQSALRRPKTEALKKVFKETNLKKQQQEELTRTRARQNEPELNTKPPAKDDEALYKTLIRKMRDLGVSQRKARQLCREQDHKLIEKVLNTAPKRSGIKNLAAYIVTEIQDGGYENHLGLQNGQKKDPLGSPRRSCTYAHLQAAGARNSDNNVSSKRPSRKRYEVSNVKPETDAPIGYRSVEETRLEVQKIENEQSAREMSYQERGRDLAKRFQNLSGDIRQQLKTIALTYLENSVPETPRRAEMLKEPAFRKAANRTVLERFFEWTDQGLRAEQAFEKLATC